jgi:uncharacterized membrane protein
MLQTVPKHMLQTVPKHMLQTVPKHMLQTVPKHHFTDIDNDQKQIYFRFLLYVYMHVGAEKSWKKARFLIETYRAVTTSKSISSCKLRQLWIIMCCV